MAKHKYRGGRPKGVKNGESTTHTGGKKWETEEQKQALWEQAKKKIQDLGYSDSYGGNGLPSDIKKRLEPNSQNKTNRYIYTGDQDELWAYDVSSEDLLKIAYGDKEKHDRT